MSNVAECLSNVAVGDALTFRNLSVFPVTRTPAEELRYITLDEALAAKVVTVTETSERGTVPRIRLDNLGSQPILLLDGEELVGAKQNRILNLTILAPPRRALDIPVSCVEAGRWGFSGRTFEAANRAAYATLRAQKAQHVSDSLATYGSRDSDQGEIWDSIAAKSRRMHAQSATGAMSAIYDTRMADLAEFVTAFPPKPTQVGAIFAIDGEIVGLDLLDHPATFGKLFPKIVRSYALDALDAPGRPAGTVSTTDGENFVRAIAYEAETAEFPAVGLGTDIRLKGPTLTGAALAEFGTVIHLCAFRMDKGEAGKEPVGGLGRSRRQRDFADQTRNADRGRKREP